MVATQTDERFHAWSLANTVNKQYWFVL